VQRINAAVASEHVKRGEWYLATMALPPGRYGPGAPFLADALGVARDALPAAAFRGQRVLGLLAECGIELERLRGGKMDSFIRAAPQPVQRSRRGAHSQVEPVDLVARWLAYTGTAPSAKRDQALAANRAKRAKFHATALKNVTNTAERDRLVAAHAANELKLERKRSIETGNTTAAAPTRTTIYTATRIATTKRGPPPPP